MALGFVKDLAMDCGQEHVLQKLRAWRRGPLFREVGVVFLHVPRAAGTGICETLYGRFMGHFGVCDLLAVAPQSVRELPRFSVVRNPWARLVSAWSFARAGAGEGGSIRVLMHRPEQYLAPEFQDFRSFVMEWLPAQHPDRIDRMFRPQAEFVTDRSGAIALDHLGRIEALATTEHWLTQLLGYEVHFSRTNASPHADYRTYYDHETIAQVARTYRQDIDLLGFQFD